MDPAVSGLYRHVMDDVLRKTRENILIGMDEHSVDLTIERLLSVDLLFSFCFYLS